MLTEFYAALKYSHHWTLSGAQDTETKVKNRNAQTQRDEYRQCSHVTFDKAHIA